MENMRLFEINTDTARQITSFVLDDKIKIENKDKNTITLFFNNGSVCLSFDDRCDSDDIKEIKLRLEHIIKVEDVFLTSIYYKTLNKKSDDYDPFLSYVEKELEDQGDNISNYNEDVTVLDFGCGIIMLPGFVDITTKIK